MDRSTISFDRKEIIEIVGTYLKRGTRKTMRPVGGKEIQTKERGCARFGQKYHEKNHPMKFVNHDSHSKELAANLREASYLFVCI